MAITYGLRLNPTVVSAALLLGAAATLAVWRPWADETPPAPPPVIAAPPAPPPMAPPAPIAPTLTPSDVADVRLHGTFGAAAVVSVGSEVQRRIAVGRQLLPGILLESTAPDHIIVARGGTRLRIPLASFDGIAGAATVIAAGDKPQAAAKPQSKAPTLSRAAFAGENSRRQTLAFQLGLVQEKQGETPLGYRVRRAASMPFFARAGLRDGDIVVAINGGGLHGEEKVMELADELAQSKRVTISYLRGGQPHETEVNFTD